MQGPMSTIVLKISLILTGGALLSCGGLEG